MWIDESGYRLNVGVVLMNAKRKLFWARRAGRRAWQFPQGGMQLGETIEEALYRELFEEVGLRAQDVEVITKTKDWQSYRLPKQFIRPDCEPMCIGQKQTWFLLKLLSEDANISLEASQLPEFDAWRWVSYWYPMRHVIAFKRTVYQSVLREFAPMVF